MSLFGKVRTLVGALIHKPFMPKPEKVELTNAPDNQVESEVRSERSTLEEQAPEVEDTQRVADLIAREKRETVD